MTITTSWDDPKIIKIRFPHKKLQKIKEKLSVKSENISHDEYQKIFLASIKEFKRGYLSSDELGQIGNEIFFKLDKQGIEGTLAWKGYAAGEINFYIRAVTDEPDSGKMLISFLNEVYEYFEANKNKVSDYK